ncbi:tripartite motif-containing protein 16-like protein [Huso huso]|uniref:Tripartite motif-containing protein 16-like protein n=1 Tax=Huso huso TaxID=61971 RepID=A0ABR0ZR40_HUSHU
MATAGDQSAAEQFTCPICLDIFSNPVTIPCGHNFCIACIKRFWDRAENKDNTCPVCMKTFSQRPELAVNHVLETVAKTMGKLNSGTLGRPVSCLGPLIFPNSRTLNIKKSPDDPVGIKQNHCSKHNEPVSLFCRKDQTCMCSLCAFQEHEHHDVIPIEEEIPKMKQELVRKQRTLQSHVHLVKSEISKVKGCMELIKISADKEKEHVGNDFADFIKAVEQYQKKAIDDIDSQERRALKKAEEQFKRLEQKCTKLEKNIDRIEKTLKNDNGVQLLKKCKSLKQELLDLPAVDLKLDEEITFSGGSALKKELLDICNKHVNTIWKGEGVMFTVEVNSTSSPKQKPKTRKDFKKYDCKPKLDPNTAHEYLWVSQDNRKQVSAENCLPSKLLWIEPSGQMLIKAHFSTSLL